MIDKIRLNFWRNYLLSVVLAVVIGLVMSIKYTIVLGVILYFLTSILGIALVSSITMKQIERENVRPE